MYLGNAAPYHITHPITNNGEQIVLPDDTMAMLTCSLNVTIPSSVVVSWVHNSTIIIPSSEVTQDDNTTTLQIDSLQSSNAGVYQCVFNDTTGYVLRRNTILLILSKFLSCPYTSCFVHMKHFRENSIIISCLNVTSVYFLPHI